MTRDPELKKLLLIAVALALQMRELELQLNIVTLGGGSGHAPLAKAIANLRDLLLQVLQLSCLVGVSDDGGSSRFLKEKRGLFAVGDLAKVMYSTLPEYDADQEDLYATRFKVLGQLDQLGLGLANLSVRNVLVAMAIDKHGKCQAAIDWLAEKHHLRCRPIPASFQRLRLDWHVHLQGKHITIRGQRDGWAYVSKNEHRKWNELERIELVPEEGGYPIEANPAAIEALRQMDIGILAPGSQIDSIAATLRTGTIRKEWEERQADKYAFVNQMVPLAVKGIPGFLEVYKKFAFLSQQELNTLRLIVSTSIPPAEAIAAYAKEGMVPMAPYNEALGRFEIDYGQYARMPDDPRGAHIEADLMGPPQEQDPNDQTRRSLLVHDPEKIMAVLLEHVIIPAMQKKLAEAHKMRKEKKPPFRTVSAA